MVIDWIVVLIFIKCTISKISFLKMSFPIINVQTSFVCTKMPPKQSTLVFSSTVLLCAGVVLYTGKQNLTRTYE